MMDKVTMVKGRDQMIVRPRGVDKLLSEGWTILEPGADQQPQQSRIVEATATNLKAPKRKAK